MLLFAEYLRRLQYFASEVLLSVSGAVSPGLHHTTCGDFDMFMINFDCGDILPGARLEGCLEASDYNSNTKQNNVLLDHWAQIEHVTTDDLRIWKRASRRLQNSLRSFRRQTHRFQEHLLCKQA